MVQRRYLTLLLVLIVFFGSAYAASLINTDFGGVNVTEVTIPAQGYTIRGTLYTPKDITGKAPAFALAHGISNTKEVLSGVALELARNGYVALTIDEKGARGVGRRLRRRRSNAWTRLRCYVPRHTTIR